MAYSISMRRSCSALNHWATELPYPILCNSQAERFLGWAMVFSAWGGKGKLSRSFMCNILTLRKRTDFLIRIWSRLYSSFTMTVRSVTQPHKPTVEKFRKILEKSFNFYWIQNARDLLLMTESFVLQVILVREGKWVMWNIYRVWGILPTERQRGCREICLDF